MTDSLENDHDRITIHKHAGQKDPKKIFLLLQIAFTVEDLPWFTLQDSTDRLTRVHFT